jgi:hypothetical protein
LRRIQVIADLSSRGSFGVSPAHKHRLTLANRRSTDVIEGYPNRTSGGDQRDLH